MRRAVAALLAGLAATTLAGCVDDQATQLVASVAQPFDQHERDCMMRVMYFESNRSSYDGMLAVGTVVMNRKASGMFPGTVCGVVGQRNQFAAGALTRAVSSRESGIAEKAADAVMGGERHPNMDRVMYFHTAGLHFPYPNMHYRLVAGGNAFYERYLRHPLPVPTDVAAAAPEQPVATVSQTVPAAEPQTTLAYAAQPASAQPPNPLGTLLSNVFTDNKPSSPSILRPAADSQVAATQADAGAPTIDQAAAAGADAAVPASR